MSDETFSLGVSNAQELARITPANRIGIRLTDPQFPIHIQMPDGTEYTDANIRDWAQTGYEGDEPRLMATYLARAIVCLLDKH